MTAFDYITIVVFLMLMFTIGIIVGDGGGRPRI